MNNKVIGISVLCVILVSSCMPSKNQEIKGNESIKYSSSLIDTLPKKEMEFKYIPLSLETTSSIREVSKIVVRDGIYYLGDFILNKIVAINSEGKLLFTINRRGHGNGEYLELRNFTIDEEYIYVLDNSKRQIHAFDRFSGHYLMSKDTKGVIPQDIACVNDGFILCVIPMNGKFAIEQEHYLLQICDKDFNIKELLLPYNDRQSEALGKRSYFTYNGKDIIFSSYLNDAYYIIPYNNPSNISMVKLDFENLMKSNDRSNLESYDNLQFQYLSETPLLCGEWVYLQIFDKGEDVCCLYNINKGDFYSNQWSLSNIFYYPQATNDGKFISVMEYDEYKLLIPKGLPHHPEEDSLMSHSSLIIAEYEL